MRKIITLAVGMALALTALTAFSASANIVDGRPGIIDLREIHINDNRDYCKATYRTTYEGNRYVDSDRRSAEIRITENKNFLHVTCRFTDTSGVFESNAEVGKLLRDRCTYRSSEGVLRRGDGMVVAAANNGPDGSLDGGNAMIKCTFDLRD